MVCYGIFWSGQLLLQEPIMGFCLFIIYYDRDSPPRARFAKVPNKSRTLGLLMFATSAFNIEV